jgi:hypothetical protein
LRFILDHHDMKANLPSGATIDQNAASPGPIDGKIRCRYDDPRIDRRHDIDLRDAPPRSASAPPLPLLPPHKSPEHLLPAIDTSARPSPAIRRGFSPFRIAPPIP